MDKIDPTEYIEKIAKGSINLYCKALSKRLFYMIALLIPPTKLMEIQKTHNIKLKDFYSIFKTPIKLIEFVESTTDQQKDYLNANKPVHDKSNTD